MIVDDLKLKLNLNLNLTLTCLQQLFELVYRRRRGAGRLGTTTRRMASQFLLRAFRFVTSPVDRPIGE
jgi:hypothetical protein